MTKDELESAFKTYAAYQRNCAGKKALEDRLCRQYQDMAKEHAARAAGLDYEEAYAEAIYAVLRGIRGYDHKSGNAPSTYVFTCIGNALRNLKAKQPVPNVPLESVVKFAEQEEPEIVGYNEVIVQLINQNKAAIPPRGIRLLRRIYVQEPGVTIEELAKEMGASEKALKKTITNMLVQLKEANA